MNKIKYVTVLMFLICGNALAANKTETNQVNYTTRPTFTNSPILSGGDTIGWSMITNTASYIPSTLDGVSNQITMGLTNYYEWRLTNSSTLVLTPCATNIGASLTIDVNRQGQTFTISALNCITSGLGSVSLLTNSSISGTESYLFVQPFSGTNTPLIGGYQLR